MKLALGTVQFGLSYGIANRGGRTPVEVAGAMLRLAEKAGIDTLDTAAAYGSSEDALGVCGVEGFRLVTKLPALPTDCRDVEAWILDQTRASLKRLKLSSVHGVLLHRPEQLLGGRGAELNRALQALKDEGLTTKIGVSIYSPGELDEIFALQRFDLVQAPFSLVDRRLQTSGWLDRLKDQDVEVHTRSAFLQGLLLMPQGMRPAAFHRWDPIWREWHGWIQSEGCSALEACLSYPLSIHGIDRVVVGADTLEQLGEILVVARHGIHEGYPDISCSDEELINPARWSR